MHILYELYRQPTFLFIVAPFFLFASIMGLRLFFVQHQFDEVYWERHEEWDFVKAAIDGSLFYKLPIVLDRLSGHIGFHHIHHLNSKIPNYNLRPCYRAMNGFEGGKTITLFESFKMVLLNLYDEKSRKLIRIRDLRKKTIY